MLGKIFFLLLLIYTYPDAFAHVCDRPPEYLINDCKLLKRVKDTVGIPYPIREEEGVVMVYIDQKDGVTTIYGEGNNITDSLQPVIKRVSIGSESVSLLMLSFQSGKNHLSSSARAILRVYFNTILYGKRRPKKINLIGHTDIRWPNRKNFDEINNESNYCENIESVFSGLVDRKSNECLGLLRVKAIDDFLKEEYYDFINIDTVTKNYFPHFFLDEVNRRFNGEVYLNFNLFNIIDYWSVKINLPPYDIDNYHKIKDLREDPEILKTRNSLGDVERKQFFSDMRSFRSVVVIVKFN